MNYFGDSFYDNSVISKKYVDNIVSWRAKLQLTDTWVPTNDDKPLPTYQQKIDAEVNPWILSIIDVDRVDIEPDPVILKILIDNNVFSLYIENRDGDLYAISVNGYIQTVSNLLVDVIITGIRCKTVSKPSIDGILDSNGITHTEEDDEGNFYVDYIVDDPLSYQTVITYNGSKEYIEVSGTTSSSVIGDYTVVLYLKDTQHYTWDDGTTEPVVVNWRIKPRQVIFELAYYVTTLIEDKNDIREGYATYKSNIQIVNIDGYTGYNIGQILDNYTLTLTPNPLVTDCYLANVESDNHGGWFIFFEAEAAALSDYPYYVIKLTLTPKKYGYEAVTKEILVLNTASKNADDFRVSPEELSWEVISSVSKSYLGANLFNIGDTKSIQLNGVLTTQKDAYNTYSDYVINNTSAYVYIIDFMHDVYKEKSASSSYNYKKNTITWGTFITNKHIDISNCDEYSGYAEFYKTKSAMYENNIKDSDEDGIYGWNNSSLQKQITDSLFYILPTALRKNIRKTHVYSYNGGGNSINPDTANEYWTDEYLTPYSAQEIFGNLSDNKDIHLHPYEYMNTSQYVYFTSKYNGNKLKYPSSQNYLIGHKYWLRSRMVRLSKGTLKYDSDPKFYTVFASSDDDMGSLIPTCEPVSYQQSAGIAVKFIV